MARMLPATGRYPDTGAIVVPIDICRKDILDNMALTWEVTQLESPDRDMLCMDMYASILSKLFSLQLEARNWTK